MAGELILIVEDNEKNLKLVRDVLRFCKYETLEAISAELGIKLAADHQPDLVLMDIQLPGIDGVTALSRLRANPTTAAIPVAALTAFAMKDEQARLLQAGFDGYMVKPISVKAFPGQIAELLARGRRGG
jgi:two-component system cell cycle response regulator DivK